MAFWRTYYHLIWATSARQPLITPEKESELYGYIIGKSDSLSTGQKVAKVDRKGFYKR
jgi:putative transposase